MVRLLKDVLCSSLVIMNNALEPIYQILCPSKSHLAFQLGHQQVAARTVEVVGTAVAEMPKVTGHLRAFTILFFFDKFVNQYNNKTTAYPHHAGLRWIPKDGIVWFINVSSETETDIESSGIKKTVY